MGVSEGPGLVIGAPASAFVGEGAIGAPDTGPAFVISPSAHIPDGGVNSTARLTAPASGTFGGGTTSDDQMSGAAVDLAINQYREDERCMQATTAAINGAVYEFFVYLDDETPLDDYTVTPQWTIGSGVPTSLPLSRSGRQRMLPELQTRF